MNLIISHETLEFTGVNLDRVVDGLIVEHRGSANLFAPLLEVGSIRISGAGESPNNTDHRFLAELAEEDQKARSGETPERTDGDRRHEVMALLASGLVRTPRDRFNAGLILQHTGLTFCREDLKSLSAENYLLAHQLFSKAFEAGLEEAGYLAAAALDRYLGFTEGRQKYGTNRVVNPVTGIEEWFPIDRSVSDEERTRMGVAQLEELLQQYPERPSPPESEPSP